MKFLVLGGKKVYWATSKVASHIRSGHCTGASKDEVQRFKDDFVYESPKNLVHRSTVSKQFKDSFEIKECSKTTRTETERELATPRETPRAKRSRTAVKYEQEEAATTDEFEDEDDDGDEPIYEQFTVTADTATTDG